MPSHDANQKIITKMRTWDVALKQLTPGAHTLRSVLRISQQSNDGFHTTEAGMYGLVVNFTVAAKLPGGVKPGIGWP